MTLNIDKYLKQGDSKLQRTSLDVSKYLNKGTPSSESQSKVYQVPDYMGGGSYRGVSGLSSKELEPYRSSRETSTTAKNEMRGGTFSDTEKEIDHIISIFLGGTDAEENQQPLQNSKSLIQAVRDVVTMNDRKASQYATRQGGKYDIEKKAIEKYRNGEIGLGAARLAILNYKKPDVAKRFLGEEDSFFDKFKDFWGGAKRKIEEYQQDDAYSGPAEEQISSKTDDRGWAAKTLIATSKFTLSIAQTVTSTLDFLIDTSIKRVGDRVIEIQEGGDGVFGNRYRTEEETSNMKDKVKQRRDDWEKFFIKNEKQMPVQKAKDFLTKIRDKRIYQPTKKWENASAVERFTPEHIGETIFELGPDIASSIATFVVAGPTVGAALFGGAAADDMKTTAMKYGVDFDDATGLGLLSGVAATVLERVLPAKLMNKKVVSKISQGLLRRVSGYLLSAGIEASTEVSQETVSLLLETTFREDLNWSEANIRLAMAGFGGALGGAGMNVLIDVVNSSKLSSVDIDDDFSVDYKQPEKTQTPPAEEGLTIEAPIDTKPKPELNIDKYLKKPVKEKTTETEAKTISMQELEIKKKEYDNFEDFKKAYKDYDIVEDSDVSYKIDDKDIEVLRGTKGMTADDIMKTHPNIKLKRDVPAKDVAGNKVLIPEGEKLTPYEMKDGKILLQDGQTYLVTKNQFANIKGQSVGGEAKPFAPELEGTEETTMGWTGDSRDLADTTRPQTKQLSDGKKQNDYGYKIDDNTLKGIWEGKQKPKPTPTPTKTITLETVNKKDLGDRSVEEVEARRKEREGELGRGDKFSLHYEKIKDMYPALDSDGMEIGVQKQKEQLDWARDYIQRNPDKAIKIAYGTADIPAGKNTQILRGATIASLYADGRVELADMIAKKASLSLTESARELSAAKMDLYPKDKPKIELGITQKRLELLGAKLGETDPTKMVQKAKEKVKSDTKNVTDKIKKTQSEMTINNLEEIDNIIDSLLC